MADEDTGAEEPGKGPKHLKARGKEALVKAKSSMDTLYGKKLTDRVEEYAQLSYHVLAAHEDRLHQIDESLSAIDSKLATTGQDANPPGRIQTLPIAWQIAIIVALAVGVASLALQLV